MQPLQGLRLERAQASAQYRDGHFFNRHPAQDPEIAPPKSVLFDYFSRGAARRPPIVVPLQDPKSTWAKPAQSDSPRITWLGHSTVMLEIAGKRLLTDPVFGQRASPFSFVGGKRLHPAPLSIAELPKIDAIILSHDHYDHLCATSIRQLALLQIPIYTSLGVGQRLEAMGYNPKLITELDWWENSELLGGTIRIHATPAQHFSGRSLRDRNQTFWSSWVIESGTHRLFFSGDTGFSVDFKEIHERFGSFDLIMLEVGAWNQAWANIHLGPTGAWKAFQALGGGTLLPIHWATFDLALHPWNEPIETLLQIQQSSPTERPDRIIVPFIGQSFQLNRLPDHSPDAQKALGGKWWLP